jgi:hypothetical protein
VIPSFPLQAALLYLGITPSEVKIDIGSAISLPNGTKIPVRSDGTLVINPAMAQRARHVALNELLLASQQHESGTSATIRLDDLRTQIVLVHTTPNSNGFGAVIAAIQTNSFVRRVTWIFDCVVLAVAAAVSGVIRRFSRVDLVLGAIALSAAYCLIALALVSGWSIWLPGWLPLGAIWASVLFAVFLPKPKDAARTVAIAAPPPAP